MNRTLIDAIPPPKFGTAAARGPKSTRSYAAGGSRFFGLRPYHSYRIGKGRSTHTTQ